MFSIWLIGFFAFILYRVFNAGMNSKSLFYRAPFYGEIDLQVDENKLVKYWLVSFVFGVSWPISLSLLGVYKLGQRFNKENVK